MLGYEYVLHQATLLDRTGRVRKHQSIVVQDGRIAWVGDDGDLPDEMGHSARVMDDCEGRLVTPGLIDCHTHLVYAGSRAYEYQQKLAGVDYQKIAKQGGGILSTVQHTREASYEALIALSLPRLKAMKAEGVTTVEIKSGYGLDLATERKMLRVARTIGQLAGVRVLTTFLGAHALPPEFAGRPSDYIDHLCQDMLPALADEGLVDAVDIFIEGIGFNVTQAERLFAAASALKLPIKCHAEQLSLMGGARLAAGFGALSCDHLEYLDEGGVKAMQHAGSVAVLLPGAYYFTGETQKPPTALLEQYHVPMAIATDSNPGTSPTTSLPLMMHMACRLMGLSVESAWQGVTHHAALALGIGDEVGELAPGKIADLVRWSTTDPADLCYYFGHTLSHELMIGGLWTT